MLEVVGITAATVAIAEIGDKTQLLTIILAAKFRKPAPIIAGILVATLLNQGASATAGYFIAKWLTGPTFELIMGLAFIVMAGWALIPDKEDGEAVARSHGGVFLTTMVAFFFVEIGDKTEVATVLLAARFHAIWLVTLGATLGMMAVNTPAVFLGEAVTRIVPLKYVRIAASVVFAALGIGVVLAAFKLL